ncbi:hypothetical protein [Ectothiorhodospira lacustris]|uniref:hypothetical protein n=1 Tax=Ectothiorhodospira lacustris TaxID=2899127 RepID=UPI001EE98BB5|nr:hypothetical protein [Ectothiorhodospira lacustris]MCG5509686.1 hypothetical protein [Ectothiorhodospira lacustris]MCG5523081.1 hypothetical protein [Ectothiorhodospira lacustris]
MLILFAFPITDLRSFTTSKTYRLPKPTVPAQPGKHFIRDTGMVHVRLQGGSQVAQGEDMFCRARGACLLPRDAAWSYLSWNGCQVRFYHLFRRYFRTGKATSRFEIGFRVATGDAAGCTHLPAIELVKALAVLPVRVSTGRDGRRNVALAAAADALADHFRIATTRQDRSGQPYPTERWWCAAGEPLVVIELDASEVLVLPEYSVGVDAIPDPGSNLRFFRKTLPKCSTPIGCWVLQIGRGARRDQARQLRMHLIRVHSEVQCLQRVVQATQTNLRPAPLSDAANHLITYLETLSKLLGKEKRYGTRQRNILDVAYESHSTAWTGELTSLLTASEGLLGDLKKQEEAEKIMQERWHAKPWERMLGAITALFIVGLVGYLVIRNEPFADQNFVVMLRILLSLAVSVVGAVIPGFLQVGWNGSGLAIRAGGALALFVLTFLLTPQVLP